MKLKFQKLFSSAELLNIFFELKEKSLNPILSGLSSGFYDLDSINTRISKIRFNYYCWSTFYGKNSIKLKYSFKHYKKFKFTSFIF
jgi:hypothetical protein